MNDAHRAPLPEAPSAKKIFYQCQRCTACCRWPGFVRITEAEIPAMAAHIGVSEDDFIQNYTRLTPRRNGLALIDKPNGECFFLEGRDCRLQAVKPKQCIGFPNTWNFPGWREICEAVPVEIDASSPPPRPAGFTFQMNIPKGDFDAYIFDCDGTLAHTMPLHYQAWTLALARQSAIFPEPLFYELGGVPTVTIVSILNERFGHRMDPETTALEKEELFVQLIPQTTPIGPVVELVHELYGKKPLAVASGGHRHIVLKTLETLNIADRFEAILGVEDYQNGKPAPDPYLEAARRLGVDPCRCLAFEDTQTGISSATAAGMQTVLVPRTLS